MSSLVNGHEIFVVPVRVEVTQMQVVIEITDLAQTPYPLDWYDIDIYNSEGYLIEHWDIGETGIFSTGWFETHGFCNITIHAAGYPYGGIQGCIDAYARGPLYVFIYGD